MVGIFSVMQKIDNDGGQKSTSFVFVISLFLARNSTTFMLLIFFFFFKYYFITFLKSKLYTSKVSVSCD